MNKNRNAMTLLLLWGSLVGGALLGCSAGSRVDQLEVAKQSTDRDITDMRALQAEHNAAVEDLRAQIRQLTGRIDELEHVSVGKTQELTRTLERFGSRVPPPEGVPADLLTSDEDKISRITGASADLYRSGLVQLRSGQFEAAILSFRDFINSNPDTAFTDNALFWKALCHENLSAFDDAILAYNEVLQRFPAEDMVPYALFRLADAFVRVGSGNDAVLTLDKLIDEYPQHKLIAEAKKKRAQMSKKKSARS